MKLIYLVHQFFPRHYTGTERLTLDMARQMQRVGHFPVVVSYEPSNDLDGFIQLTKEVLYKRYTYQSVPVIALKSVSALDPTEIFSKSIEEAAEKLSLESDLVHIFHPMWLSSFAKVYQRNSVPTVLTLTDPWLLCPSALLDCFHRICNGPEADGGCKTCNVGPRMKTRLQEAKTLFDSVDEVTAASRFLAVLFKRNGWSRDINLIPHSIDYQYVRRIEANRSKVTFGFIGTLAWHKGAYILVKAAREVRHDNIDVVIYGSTSDNPEYSRMLMDMAGGDKRIHFLGTFEMSKLPEVMSRLSALVIPSVYYENHPLVMLIAMAYQIPPVVSNIGGMPEVVKDGVNGFTFETGDYSQLAKIMSNIAGNPEILNQLKSNMMSPRRTEEEALDYENTYRKLIQVN